MKTYRPSTEAERRMHERKQNIIRVAMWAAKKQKLREERERASTPGILPGQLMTGARP